MTVDERAGSPISGDRKYCHACAAVLDARAVVCPKCGVAQTVAAADGRKERITAALLAIFLGGVGAHKFYLGKTGSGILYLLFCWTLIPALIGLIEGLVYLSMSDQRFAEKYG